MKKFLCFMLSALLFCNATVVCADDLHGGSSGSIDVTPTPIVLPDNSAGMISELMVRLIRPDVAGVVDTFQTWWDKWIGERWKTNADMSKDVSLSSDGSTVHLHKQFVDDVNQAVQDKVHALDGYYLVEPTGSFSIKDMVGSYDYTYETEQKFLEYYNSMPTCFVYRSSIQGLDPSIYYYYFDTNGAMCVYFISDKYYATTMQACKRLDFYRGYVQYEYSGKVSWYGIVPYADTISSMTKYFSGQPFKVFYSKYDLSKYLALGEKRTYAPKLPSVTIKIPVKYINNSVSLPDITYNITTENKTEVEIQNQYDTTIKNYLDSLDNFTDGTDPTPTPKPDGGFTDGTTPTPTPSIGDGGDDSGNGKVDLSEIIDLLKKILDKLTSFADSHSKFEKTITDYIESTDGKLDQIIEAIDSLSDGKTEDEKNGCKYDFTALSDFMTDLWNESDKKFDTMIDLLEENNKYQQKLVNSLNEIKAILITQTVLDLFTDRSSETANKAKEKFPTSLPWDIALVVNAMSAEPEQLKFTIPVKIESLNINEEINIDLTSEEWEKLAKTCRYLLSILFILFMIHLSRKLFSNGGED